MYRLRSSSFESASSRSRTSVSSTTIVLILSVGGIEADVLEHALEDRVQPAGADVLGRPVDLEGQVGHGFDGVAGEFERDSLGAEQGLVLAEQRGPRLAEDPGEVVAGQVVHLDADREPALELGHQVRRLGAVERAGGDEQDVVGLDRPVLGVDGRPLDDRQQVALHALARDVRAARRALVAGDLVDLVDEDDARSPRPG